MESRTLIAACLVLAASPIAFSQTSEYVLAHDGFSHVSGAYVWQDFEFGDDDADINDADGWGVSARYAFMENFFATGEYSMTEFDNGTDTEFEQWRVGGGFAWPVGDRFLPYVQAQFINMEIDSDPGGGSVESDGGAFHVGVHFPATPRFRLFAEAGYLHLDDIDGWEVGGGLSFRLTGVENDARGGFGLFADARFSDLETDLDDTGDEVLEITQIRGGVRFEF